MRAFAILLLSACACLGQGFTFTDVAFLGNNQVAAAGGTTYTLKESDTTDSTTLNFGSFASNVKTAESWVSGSAYSLAKISVFVGKDGTGDPSTTISLAIYSNSTTNAPAVVIANGNATESYGASSIVAGGTWLDFTFSTAPSISSGVTNWIVISCSAADPSNHYFAMHVHDIGTSGRNIYRTTATPNWSSPDGTTHVADYKAYTSP